MAYPPLVIITGKRIGQTMRKSICMLAAVVALTGCTTKGISVPGTDAKVYTDTIHDGGLCLLHGLTVTDGHGKVLFRDTINDFEPDPLHVYTKEEAGQPVQYLLFRPFDPCEEREAVEVRLR